jgi:hypothetical protein
MGENRAAGNIDGLHTACVFRECLRIDRSEIRARHDPSAHGLFSLCGFRAAHISSVAGDGLSAYATKDVPQWSKEGKCLRPRR